MDNAYFKKISAIILLVALGVLAFFLVKPILLSVIGGVILAFIFMPVYNWASKFIKSKNLCALLVCVLLLIVIVLPFCFLIPVFVNQSVRFYSAMQRIDIVTPIKSIFPSLFSTEKFTEDISLALFNFTTKITNSLLDYVSGIILNLPTILIQLAVILFTFFFVLRDKKQIFSYATSMMPFSKEVEEKILEHTRAITVSVIYGQVIIGFIQGIIAGAGFFIFGVPNSLLFTFLACIVGILPIVGTAIIYVPIVIYLFITGNTFAAVGVLIFGIVSSTIDNFLRPIIVAKRSKIHPAILLIGMIGGLFMFGVLGFILGPLIIAYLLIFLEVYRDKKAKGILFEEETS